MNAPHRTRRTARRSLLVLAAVAEAALALSGCTPQVVKDAAPPIRATIGKEKAPDPEVLPIIKSEDVAPDAQKAADRAIGRLRRVLRESYFDGVGVGKVTEPLLPASLTAAATNAANCSALVKPPW